MERVPTLAVDTSLRSQLFATVPGERRGPWTDQRYGIFSRTVQRMLERSRVIDCAI